MHEWMQAMTDLQLIRRIECHAAASRIAYVELKSSRWISYADLLGQVRGRFVELCTSVGATDVVMLRCDDRVDFASWFLAILACGARVLPVAPALTMTELRNMATRAGATAIVADVSTRIAMEECLPLSWDVHRWNGSPEVFDEEMNGPIAGDWGDLLLSSSGTTGEPKIVHRTAASLDAVARNMVEAIGFGRRDHVLSCVPLSHSYGLEHGLLAPLWAGSTVHLCDGLDLPQVTRALAGPITVWPAVPSMIEMLAAVGDESLTMPSLRVVYSAGGPLPRAVYDRFQSRFGVRVGQLYGMTEIGSVTFGSPSSETFEPASVGRPMRGVSVRVLNVDDAGQSVAPGEEGEIAVRAPSMFRGYVGAGAALVDGHFRTGDLGHLTAAGNVVITGRVRLLIDTGGLKVNPLEVEAVLGQHPQVADCVVVPVRQSETVQRLKAIIVPRDVATPPDVIELRRFTKERLASYKVPRLFEFARSLPRNDAGKIKRQLLEAP
ncbi:MAG TPA: class I adenylate-forming enzyme family protein [Tepidisphaeraceae bacterium]|jgi:acyl-coenzyme A synthetase/AMP-(fatty) acid ligase|nr:class I adenylate-forming enzyme family protein [Tepidisphaeraceae bacterium]